MKNLASGLRVFLSAAYDHVGLSGILSLVLIVIPVTVVCLVYGAGMSAIVLPAVGWTAVRVLRVESKKRDEEQARRATVRSMVDDVLASGRASCELTREQVEDIR